MLPIYYRDHKESEIFISNHYKYSGSKAVCGAMLSGEEHNCDSSIHTHKYPLQERVNSHAMPTWLQSQNAVLSLKLDGLFEDLHKRVQSLETLIGGSLTRNTASTSSISSFQKSIYTQPEPERGEPISAARCISGNDQAVPLRKDLLSYQGDTFKVHTQQAHSKDCLAKKVSPTSTDQKVISTVCDADLTKQYSLSACSQMIPSILKLEERNRQIKNGANSEKIKGLCVCVDPYL